MKGRTLVSGARLSTADGARASYFTSLSHGPAGKSPPFRIFYERLAISWLVFFGAKPRLGGSAGRAVRANLEWENPVLKKILQMSALASVLAIAMALPAAAATEEDAAAPVGSFTSDMSAPMNPRFEAFMARHPGFARHMHERMMRRAALERSESAR